MKTINSHTQKGHMADDIPLLQDRCDNNAEKTDPTLASSVDKAVKYPANHRSNPFLPYDTLEKLAAERVQFQQQLAEFDHYFNEKKVTGKSLAGTTKTNISISQSRAPAELSPEIKTESIQQLIQTMTQAVMAEYSAEIEMEVFRRVKTKLLGTNPKDIS
jgi:hypothetical protein